MELNKIYCWDCIDILSGKWIADNTIDLLLTDPPYNISKDNNFSTMKSANRQWVDFGDWDKWFNQKEWIKYLPRVLKDNANVVIFNCWERLKEVKDACDENNISIKRCLVLRKSNPAPFNRDRMFVNDVEFALWWVYNSKNKPTKWTFNRKNSLERCTIDTTVQSSKYHPTMKDVKVIKYLIELLSNEWDTVLDCYLWSGTTAVACKELNRNFIGIEINPEYVEIAKNRLKEVEFIQQQKLF